MKAASQSLVCIAANDRFPPFLDINEVRIE